MTRARLWKRLRAARWWIVAAALVGVAGGVVVAWKLVQPTYETSAVAEYRPPESIAGVDPPPLVGTLEGLRSQTTLRELRERLGLDVPTEQLAARFDLGYERRTQVLSVTARGATAEEAETLANAVVGLLVERQDESYARRVERARRRASEQLEEAQERIEEADRAFEAFQRETGLDGLSFDERRVLSEAATVEAERASAEARVAALEHRITQLAEEMGAAPQQLSASVRAATQERNQLQQLRTKLATAEATLDPGHPRRQALERQTRALRLQQVSRSMQDQGQSGLAFQHLDRLSSQQSAARANLEAERERLARLTEQAAAAQERASDVAEHADEAATLMARRRAARDRVAELSSLEAHLEALSTPD
ncbi:MAG TPA: Wzz/FepE/Etk N-terminal domain-containing protein, partial [Polyangiaceae bacterium LLY-WYZ-15_(1-7)]|nr:Wzz/FepE/Etk N-terminal domain-containing protein [Polyangiaceae bacterium LLY-WYZ-15_(1-7)]